VVVADKEILPLEGVFGTEAVENLVDHMLVVVLARTVLVVMELLTPEEVEALLQVLVMEELVDLVLLLLHIEFHK